VSINSGGRRVKGLEEAICDIGSMKGEDKLPNVQFRRQRRDLELRVVSRD
jgi:hypothetical protein